VIRRCLAVVALPSLLLGALLGVVAGRDAVDHVAGGDAADEVPLAAIVDRPPPGGRFVRVRDFQMLPGWVLERRAGAWDVVWIPLRPVGVRTPRTTVVVRTRRVADEAALAAFYRRTSLAGVVNDDPAALGAAQLAELRRHSPNLDFSSVLVLDEGREPPGLGWVVGVGCMGLGLVALGVVGLRLLRRRRGDVSPSPPRQQG
jgi:hypothetical protein